MIKKSLLFIFSFLAICQFGVSQTTTDSLSVDPNTIVVDSLALDTVETDSLASIETPTDTTSNKRVIPALGIQLDYGKVATLLTDFEQKFEIAISYRLANKITPSFHYGWGKLTPGIAISNGNYESTGTYFRFGIDYYIPFDQVNAFYIGAKYGRAQFDENGTYTIESDLWPTLESQFDRKGLTANWFELVIGSEKTMRNKLLILGGYLSIRRLNQRDEPDSPIDTYVIPGYGRVFDKTAPAINLYIKYNLNLKK